MGDKRLFVGLIHYPVLNKQEEVITTSITNMDIHDISRTCMTFGVNKFFIVNPLESQLSLYTKLTSFWQGEAGQSYQADRARALEVTSYQYTLKDVIEEIKNQEGVEPIVITTTARKMNGQVYFNVISGSEFQDRPILLLFGTGYGLAQEVHRDADYILEPITGFSEYNHLSVRCAVALVLDRLHPRNKGGINGFSASSQ